MRALPALAVAALAVTISTFASADDSLTASGAGSAPVASLPAGSFVKPPRMKSPGSIPAGEKAPGFFLVTPPAFRGKNQGYVMLVGDANEAKEFAKGGFRGEEPKNGDVCFTEQRGRFRGEMHDDGNESPSWESDLRAQLTFSNSTNPNERQGVMAVHSERLVTNGASVTLEASDAWIDPVTRGTRLIGKSSLPLSVVGTYMDGAQKVYAGRDGDLVHVVLVRAMPKENDRRGRDVLITSSQDSFESSVCDHVRTTLKVAKGQASTSSIVSGVSLASLDKKDDAKKEDVAGLPPAEMRRQMFAQMSDLRSRPMHVSPSVSWPTREREALLTVSAGWDSREQNGFGSF